MTPKKFGGYGLARLGCSPALTKGAKTKLTKVVGYQIIFIFNDYVNHIDN